MSEPQAVYIWIRNENDAGVEVEGLVLHILWLKSSKWIDGVKDDWTEIASNDMTYIYIHVGKVMNDDHDPLPN